MLAERITSPSTDRKELTLFRTHSSALFVVAKKINSFGIKQIHTLTPKQPGSVYPKRISDANRVGTSAPLIDFYTACFHALTNPFFSNPFPFTSIQNGGRAKSTSFKSKWKSVRQVSNAENEKSTGRY